MEGDKTTVLPLAPTPYQKKKRGNLDLKEWAREQEKKEKEQERHPFCLYFDDSFPFQILSDGGGGGGGRGEGGGGAAKVAVLNELFLSVHLIPGKVWSIFSIAWHLEWVAGKQDNSIEVGGSSEHGPARLQTWTRSRPPLNPITTAAPGLKRPSREGGKASSSSHIENMPL